MSLGFPFANGTEGDAWQSAWCNHCVHDHETMHGPNPTGPGCDVFGYVLFANRDSFVWPECWIAGPDFWRHLPARIACLKFEPCACGPDPAGDERVEYIASIKAEMRTNS